MPRGGCMQSRTWHDDDPCLPQLAEDLSRVLKAEQPDPEEHACPGLCPGGQAGQMLLGSCVDDAGAPGILSLDVLDVRLEASAAPPVQQRCHNHLWPQN